MAEDRDGAGGGAEGLATPGATATPITLVESGRLEEALGALTPAQAAWARSNGFSGRLGTWLALPDETGDIARVLVGWGDPEAHRRERFGLGGFAARAPAGNYRLESEPAPEAGETAALGWLLARYGFERYKQKGGQSEALLAAPPGVDAARLAVIAEGVFIARDLINTPANDMGPAALEGAARRLAERHGAEFAVTAGPDLIAENLPLIHAVGRAGTEPPRLIDIAWGPADAPILALVGKGVCFDSGGLDIKPASGMRLMKKDMGGAATVLGLAHMIMALGLGVRLRVLIPAVENAISAESFRPGDVLRSRKGLTVEVSNTDAEGRLVLADALALASEEAPDLILDMATLTGAARVALGPDVVPFFTDDEPLATELAGAAERVADPLWRLPLWPAYEADIEPDIADLDNAPSGGMAGAITAALFLRRFVDQTAWAHFDLYGWTPKARPGRPKGGECQAARACLEVLEARYGRREGG
jgi:leucyl aminopeptidase